MTAAPTAMPVVIGSIADTFAVKIQINIKTKGFISRLNDMFRKKVEKTLISTVAVFLEVFYRNAKIYPENILLLINIA